MKKLSLIIEQAGRGTIKSTGSEAVRHAKQYITPFLPGGEKHQEGTHTVAKDTDGLKANDQVTIHAHHQEDIKGKTTHFVTVSKAGSKEKVKILASKLHKPGETPVNKGLKYENDFIEHVKKHGIMPKEAKGAGSTAGTDFVIENKKKHTMHSGVVNDESNIFHGETKEDVRAAFGQLTIHHTPEKGWHISDKARAQRPGYAAEIEKAGIIEHMNKHYDPDKHVVPTTASGRAKSLTFKHPDLNPAEAYLKDHHVHVLQVGGGYGTYSVGDKDQTGHGFPRVSGRGKWTIREKQAGNKRARTVMFQPDGVKGLNKSHLNLENEEHMTAFKKTLGHAK